MSYMNVEAQMVSEIVDYAIFMLDPQGNVLSWNRGAQRIKGYTEDDILGQNFRIFYIESERKAHLPEQILQTAKEKGRVEHSGWRVRKDGSRFWANVVLTALYDGEGGINGYAKITQDLTEKKKQEEEIRSLNQALEERVRQRTAELEKIKAHLEDEVQKRTHELLESNKELEAFSYSVSHDLRAPLRAISGYTEILMEDHSDSLGQEGKKVANVILRNVARMGLLIDEILNFSRISRQQIAAAPVNMYDMFQSVWKELTALEPEERQLHMDLDPLPNTHGDHAMLQMLVTNLVSNAIKYTRPKENTVIHVGHKMVDTKDTYFIEDNGVGFDEAYKGKLFEVFHRLHKDSDFEGTGVGLAIAQRIVAKHGGHIWGESPETGGATFYFTLS